ncbi:MAG: VWA domain-containing protein [Phycisphaerales bacterium]|nr:VWA domain-containing protein [Phycisphaerales bacterium]
MLLAVVTETQRQTFELPGLPGGWLRFVGLLAVGALCWAVVWMYRREARVGAPLWLRGSLAALRCAVILLLVAVWLGPSIATEAVRVITARVHVLVDVSASMSIPDGPPPVADGDPEPPTRAQRVASLLGDQDHAWLRALAAQNDLAVHAFGERAVPLALPWAEPTRNPTTDEAAPDSADAGSALPAAVTTALSAVLPDAAAISADVANRTDAGQAVVAALSESADSPTAALILISDGASNAGMSADETIAYARRMKAPVFAVGVGAAQEPPNLRVVSVSAPAGVPREDPFEVRVELAASGVERAAYRVELSAQRLDDAGGGSEQVVAGRTVELGGDRATAVELFRVQPAAAGEFLYRARIEPAAGEVLALDNTRETAVNVLDQKTRVLIVAGRPTYDYRQLVALLERDRTVDLSCWLQSADAEAVREGNTVITELPRRAEELFAYDAVLLIDPNPADLDSAWAITVRRLVDELGGGVLLQAGPQYTGRFLRDPRLVDLVGILPVAPDPDSEVRLSDLGTYRTQATMLEAPDESAAHPLLALHADPQVSARIWRSLPGAWWYMPVQREKQLATVLLRGRGAPVLLAAQPFGAGRTAFLGFDSTWRWRSVGERYFNRFWIQTVRYLAQARRQGGGRRASLTLDRDTVNVGDYVRIEAQILDPSFNPWHEAEAAAAIEFSDGARREIVLAAQPGRDGWYAGRVLADREGLATVRVPLPGDAAGGARRGLRVHRPDVELSTLRMQRETLERIAQETGGRFLALDAAAGLPREIGSGAEVRPPVRIGTVEMWDRGWLLAVLAGLLSVEWALRRRSQLL